MNATPFPFSEWLVLALFLLFVGATVAGALIAVNTLRIIRSVSGLALCCIGLAGLYYFLNSPFLALMEILIYVGAVCVTIIFAIMLAEADEPAPERQKKPFPVIGAAVSAAISAGLFYGVYRISQGIQFPNPVAKLNEGSVADIGKSLLSTYSFAFELISLVLLVAILGALVIARSGRNKE